MYVCICRAVTEEDIRATLDDGACSMRELRQRLGVCCGCCKCAPHVRKLLVEHRQLEAPSMNLIGVEPA